MEEKTHAFPCNCETCQRWRQGIWESGKWPRPHYYNGEVPVTKKRIEPVPAVGASLPAPSITVTRDEPYWKREKRLEELETGLLALKVELEQEAEKWTFIALRSGSESANRQAGLDCAKTCRAHASKVGQLLERGE